MDSQNKAEFKDVCTRYLSLLSIADLRVYGRQLGLPAPTKLKKAQLIEDIIAVLCAEKAVERTKRGAPIKNKHCEQEIPLQIEKIKAHFLDDHIADIVEDGETDALQRQAKDDEPTLQISINIKKLTERQRQLLRMFLDSF